jgi:uncharacterized protein
MGKRVTAAGLIAALVLLVQPALAGECSADRLELRGPWGQAQFTVEVADSPAEREKGLMFRESLPQSAGMLFRYETPRPASFWMKNTLIPLDMLFADESGVVRHIHSNAVPGDTTAIKGGSGILVVLEINGGLAKRLGITEGTQMRTPLVDQAVALWPC